MLYSSERFTQLFDLDHIADTAIQTNIGKYRCKTIKSGRFLECEIFPLWNTANEIRKAKQQLTRKAQQALNEKNSRKRLERKLNANFDEKDCCVTLTYAGDFVPDADQARKDMQNYIRRIRAYRRKHGLCEMKYIYVVEYANADGVPKRVHHHVVMSGMPRDDIERLWGKGYANCRRLQPNEYGLKALSRYMTKQNKGGKRWCSSKNLAEPIVTTSDTRISRRKVECMVADFTQEPKKILERMYKNYTFTNCEIKRSDFVAGVYIYAKLRKETQ